MRKEKTKVKGRAGAFWGGTFIGFLLTLALLAGIGCFIYFKASVKMINKTFKTDISLGSDELNKKTISQLVSDVNGIVKNKETYSINDLQNDFGLKVNDTLFGIDITDLKSVGLSGLADAVEKKFGAISANELKNVSGMNLEAEMGHILKQTSTYYYNPLDRNLYENYARTKKVAFEYELIEINDVVVKIKTKGHETALNVDGSVNIQLWYLPLTSAIGDFTANLGTNMTLGTLHEDFGINLPKFLDISKDSVKNATINELEELINDMYLAEFLGYSVEDGVVKDKNSAVVTGLMEDLALKKVADLKNGGIESIVGNMTAEDLKSIENLNLQGNMGAILDKTNTYYLRNSNNKLYKEYDGTSYSNLADFEYTVDDEDPDNKKVVINGNSFDVVDGKITPTLWELPLATGIGDFIAKMGDNLTLTDLEDFGVELTGLLGKLPANTTINEIEDAVNDLYVADFLGYTVNGTTVMNGSKEVTGFMKTIALKTIGELDNGGLENTINAMPVAEILGLTIVSDGDVDKVYDGSTEVTGVLAKVAKLRVDGLKEGIKTLKLTDVFSAEDFNSGVLSLISNPETVDIDNIPEAIQTAVQTKTVRNLIDAGVILKDDLSANTKKVLTTSFDHDANAGTADITLDTFTVTELMDVLGNKTILSQLVIILSTT